MHFNKSWLYWYIHRKRRKSNIRKDGHSQYGQDVVVYELLGCPPQGVFIDIGANDGVTFSNSLLFEEKGWTGVCVEPHPDIFQNLPQNRNCHLVNACIADEDEWVDFLVVEGHSNMLSGIYDFLDQRHLKRIDAEIERYGGNKRVVTIEALSPESLLRRFSINNIDYLSIDTEGCELPILKKFDYESTSIKAIGVENGTRSPDLFRFLTSKGYKLVKCVGCDEIYMRP